MRHLVPKMSCPFWLVPIKSHKAPFLHRPPLWSKGDPGSRLLPPRGAPSEAGHTGWGRGWGPPSLHVDSPPPQFHTPVHRQRARGPWGCLCLFLKKGRQHPFSQPSSARLEAPLGPSPSYGFCYHVMVYRSSPRLSTPGVP